MREELVEILTCPCCLGSLEVYPLIVENKEIKAGTLSCRKCGSNFEIRDYIPSFISSELVDKDTINDAYYWGNYYQILFKFGIMNFVDVREPYAFFNIPSKRLRLIRFEDRMKLNKNFGILDCKVFQNDEFFLCINNHVVNDRLHQGSRVLELGAGSGWFSLELKRKGYNVIGVDPSFNALKVGKTYALSKGLYVEYINASATQDIFREEVFDGIFAFHALHHISNFERLIKLIRKWLKQGGLISIYEPRTSYFMFKILNIALSLLPHIILAIKGEPRNRFPLPRGSSANEGVSTEKIDSLSSVFRPLIMERFISCFDKIPSLLYFLSGSEKMLYISAILFNNFARVLKRFLPGDFVYMCLEKTGS